MNTRWVLSQFVLDSQGRLVPVIASYGANYLVPTNPAAVNDWALVLINMDANNVAAAAQDARCVVCPMIFDPTPLNAQVTTAYASWKGVAVGMSLGALLVTLAATEPVFAIQTL